MVDGISPSAFRRPGVHPQTAAGLALLAGLGAAVAAVSRADGQFGIFALLGVGFGVALQRSRFCINSAFRDLIQFRSGRTMKGVIVGMAVATVGFGLHMYTLMPNPTLGPVAPEAHAVPLSAALVVGGVLFGVGMVLAGGCTSGSLYRMGEGYLASWVSLAGILVGLVLVSHSWTWWWVHVIRPAPVIWFPRALGYGPATLLTLVLLLAAYLLVLWVESRGGGGVTEAPAPPAAPRTFADAVRVLAASVVGRGWPAAVGGAVLGGLNVLSYTAHMPWRIVGELSRWANAAAGLVGLSPLLAHEFKVRVPRSPVRYAQSLGGGVLMGYGAGLALGCTVGAFFSAIPSLALNGWVFAASLAAGAWVGVRVLERIP
ncbi:MAG: YeeE/YedE family protein [Armatimonadota bacterium]|nr:YeeE/YedE family protein [Armatimonadota bacterium]MDR7582475.1 YeeE/YedE family protein [Armatimonadota bacterium]